MRLSKSSILKLKHYADPLSYVDLYIEVVSNNVGYKISPDCDIDRVPFNSAQYIFVRNNSSHRIIQAFKNINQFLQHFCYLRNSLLF